MNQFDEERIQDLHQDAKIDESCTQYKGTITYTVTKDVEVLAGNLDTAEDIAIEDVYDYYKNEKGFDIDVTDIDLTEL